MGRSKKKSKKPSSTGDESSAASTTSESTVVPSSGWTKWFVIDLRSIAALRIVLGGLVLLDLLYRWPTLKAMCTDDGFLSRATRAAWLETQPAVTQFGWSLHCLSGEAWWQMVLFAVAAIFATMLLVGAWTRIAVIGSWALLVSMHSRNPIILSSGDTYLKVVMFWAMFLPIAEVWSIDARWRRRNNKQATSALASAVASQGRFVSGATFGLISALFVLYFLPGVAKWNEIWLSGDAMEYVLRLDIYATEFGRGMLQRPELLKWLSWVTLAVEIVVPVALLLLWPFALMRYFGIIVFILLHIGITCCMDIGLFPYICSGIWIFVLPGSFWERLGLKLPKQEAGEQTVATSAKFYSRIVSVFCFGLALYFFCWNVAHFNNPICKALMPDEARGLNKMLNMRQGFMMFDRPGNQSPWFVYEAKLVNGESVDVFRNQPTDHSRPESVRLTMPKMQWRRIHRNLILKSYASLRQPLAEYIQRSWNESHDEQQQIKMLKVTFHSAETVPRGDPVGELTEVWFQVGKTSVLDDLENNFNNGGSWLPD